MSPGKRDRESVTKAEEALTVIRRQIERGSFLLMLDAERGAHGMFTVTN